MSNVHPTEKTPDWSQLKRALMVEADRGFNDLEGHQQRFSEFLQRALSSPSEPLTEDNAGVWRERLEMVMKIKDSQGHARRAWVKVEHP